MTPPELEAYLDEQRILNVATIGPSGHPHLVAMWYAVRDEKIVFWTFGKSQKIVNLRRDPKMTGLVESGDSYSELRGVELVGTGRIVEDYDEILEIGKLVGVRYNGEGALSDAALPFLEAQAKQAARCRVRGRAHGELGPPEARRRVLTMPAEVAIHPAAPSWFRRALAVPVHRRARRRRRRVDPLRRLG